MPRRIEAWQMPLRDVKRAAGQDGDFLETGAHVKAKVDEASQSFLQSKSIKAQNRLNSAETNAPENSIL